IRTESMAGALPGHTSEIWQAGLTKLRHCGGGGGGVVWCTSRKAFTAGARNGRSSRCRFWHVKRACDFGGQRVRAGGDRISVVPAASSTRGSGFRDTVACGPDGRLGGGDERRSGIDRD